MALIVEWSEQASSYLQKIFDYLKPVAGMRTASKVTGKIVKRTRILAENPLAGPCEELLRDASHEFRYLVEGNYKILYYVTLEKAVIASIFDCRQNPKKMLEEVKK